MARLCPHCRRPLNTILPLEVINELDALDLPRKERAALDALVSSYPRFVTPTDFEQWMWEDVGEKTPDCDSKVFAHISKLRKKIKVLGYDIKTKRFTGTRLVLKSTVCG